MFVLILGLFLSVASAQTPVQGHRCGDDPCWQFPDDLPPGMGSLGVTEDRALAALLCHLECLERGAEGNKSTQCQDQCITTSTQQLDAVMHSSPPPSSEPLANSSGEDGVFIITIPDIVATGGNSDTGNSEVGSGGGNLLGSGDTGSGDTGSGNSLEVYLIRVEDQTGRVTYFPLTSASREIRLVEFACSEVNISYAVVTRDRVSQYSPPQTICVFLPQRTPGAAQNLNVEFVEDASLPQQAIVSLSWESPPDLLRLEKYILTIQRIPHDVNEADECAMQDAMKYNILDRGLTNFSIIPMKNDSRLKSPLYGCNYIISLQSVPGNDSVSKEVLIAYNTMTDREPLDLDCIATYLPQNFAYNLSISWTIVDPLVLQAVQEYRLSLSSVHKGISVPKAGQQQNRSLLSKEGQTNFTLTFSVNILTENECFTLSVSPRAPRFGPRDDFYWRRSLVPPKAICNVDAPAFPPTPISSDTIRLSIRPVMSPDSLLHFNVTWAQPAFLNGQLQLYELCIGEETVSGSEECMEPSQYLCVRGPQSTEREGQNCQQLQSPDFPERRQVEYHVGMDEMLFVQIRASNNFMLYGNWSDPILVFKTTATGNGTDQTSISTSSGLDAWVYAVLVLAFITLVVTLVLLIICVYKYFCFHRRIKYENDMVLDHLNGDYLPPGARPVADEWELQWDDIEIHYDEELGNGAFGRVYRGVLHSRELRQLVSEEDASNRRWSLTRKKSLTRRKPTVHRDLGSCVVAIKRLKDNIDGPDKANFLKEIEMMKTVSGSHHDHQKFVVNMLGCVTLQEPMMLVLEYASHGDLLSYLRASRDTNHSSVDSKAAPYLEPSGAYSKLAVKGRETEEEETEEEEEEEEEKKLTQKDLLSFARQIAGGMEFLASLSVVHRDLACRNILVCDSKLIKISDFGLSRSLVNQEAYVTTTKGVLPIRWMAPEALFYRTFDTQSDVWSFGILLWEIFTLGGYPYPTKSNRDILDLLTTGYRMEKPEFCVDEVYDVMLRCWNQIGVDRPTFESLYATFDNFLGETTRNQFPYMQVLGTYYYDRLEERQNSQELLDLERAPANVDTRQYNVPGPETHTQSPPSQGNQISASPQGSSNLVPPSQGASQSLTLHNGQDVRERRLLGQGHLTPSLPGQENRSTSPNQDWSGAGPSPAGSRLQHNRDSGLDRSPALSAVSLPRPRSWVGMSSSAELGPRYVPTPLCCSSPVRSTSNLTQETAFVSLSFADNAVEHRLSASHSAQSRSVGCLTQLSEATLNTRDRRNL